jgi:hypothetical protein
MVAIATMFHASASEAIRRESLVELTAARDEQREAAAKLSQGTFSGLAWDNRIGAG